MLKTSKKLMPMYMLYFITINFYVSKILHRPFYQTAGKCVWMIFTVLGLLMLITSYYLFKKTKIAQTTPTKLLKQQYPILYIIMRFSISIYLFLSQLFVVISTVTLIYITWLHSTSIYFTLIPLFIIIYLAVQADMKSILRISSTFSFIILAIYITYALKVPINIDLPSLLPNLNQIPTEIFLTVSLCLTAFFEIFLILFYIPYCDEEPKFSIFFIFLLINVVMTCFDAFVTTNLFGELVKNLSYTFYEKMRLIYFGEYIGYLDQIGFIYLMLSAFLKLSLNTFIFSQLYKKFNQSKLIFLILSLAFSIICFNNAPLYVKIRVPLIVISGITLMIGVIVMIILLNKRRLIENS